MTAIAILAWLYLLTAFITFERREGKALVREIAIAVVSPLILTIGLAMATWETLAEMRRQAK